MGLKRCQECKQEKPREKFNKWRGKPTGKCKSCQNKIIGRNRRIKKQLWWKVMISYMDGACCRCLSKDNGITPDHIIATTRGGDDSPCNIQPLCQKCNTTKGVEQTDYRPLELVRIMELFSEQ